REFDRKVTQHHNEDVLSHFETSAMVIKPLDGSNGYILPSRNTYSSLEGVSKAVCDRERSELHFVGEKDSPFLKSLYKERKGQALTISDTARTERCWEDVLQHINSDPALKERYSSLLDG